jgi:hypothetical protein
MDGTIPCTVSEPLRKSKEELLSEEVHAAAEMSSRFLQWGVTLMISIQTALFFVRHDVLQTEIDAGRLPKGSPLPPGRYLIGTGFLCFVALILSIFTARANEQYRHYKLQLAASRESGIKDLPIKRIGSWAYPLYFAFPVIDFLVKFVIKVSLG